MNSKFRNLVAGLTVALVATFPAWPASAATVTPTWVGGSAPVPSISGVTMSVTIPDITANSQYGTAFQRAWACSGSVTAGFADWPYNGGASYLPPSTDFPVAGVNCQEFANFEGTSNLDLSTAVIDLGGGATVRYNPYTHGFHIVVGRRFTDNAGTTSGNTADDVYWLAYSASIQFVPPTVTTQPTLSLNDQFVTATATTWSAGTEDEFLVACTTSRATAVTTATRASDLQAGCKPLYASNNPSDSTMAFRLGAAYVPDNGSRVAYDSATHGAHIGILSINTGVAVATATVTYGGGNQSNPGPVTSAPYTGPVVNPPALSGPVARGGKVTLGGSNLSGVTKVEINGLDCAVSVNLDGELEITVPAGLAAGTYDLVVTSSSGKLTVQDGIRVSAESVAPLAGQDVRPSAKKNELSSEVKVRLFDVVGAGKVQIFVNGKEIAWVNAVDSSDSKLFDGYLVRTVSLVEGKTAIEVFVDGTRVQRWAYGR